ncbi:hypothetical protein PM082_007144 [Marasmius tenuissimus]|nr:hypothetical protein PM082_007144 [Marasmius tenuissimus]
MKWEFGGTAWYNARCVTSYLLFGNFASSRGSAQAIAIGGLTSSQIQSYFSSFVHIRQPQSIKPFMALPSIPMFSLQQTIALPRPNSSMPWPSYRCGLPRVLHDSAKAVRLGTICTGT